MLLVFNKPYGVLSQFTDEGSKWKTLAGFGFPPDVYSIGRLDADSEGLIALTDERQLVGRLLEPKHEHAREYYAQVERVPSEDSLKRLKEGLLIQGHTTKPCKACLIDPEPEVGPRVPPIRFRKNIPTTWVQLILTEGRNRQVRRMTAAIGHPTLRLVRVRIGSFCLGDLPVGDWRELGTKERDSILSNGRLS